MSSQAEARKLFEEAQTARARGDLGTAEKKYLEVIRLAPGLSSAYQNLGITYFTERKYTDAAHALEKAVKFSPRLAPAHFMLGLAYYELYEQQKALDNFRAAVALNPRDTNALLYLGKSQLQIHDYAGAAQSFERLNKMKPEDADVLYNLSLAYLKLMLTSVARLGKAAPDSYQLWSLLAQDAEARGDYVSAAKDLEHALRVKPNAVGIHYALGSIFAKDGKYAEATEEFTKELKINPNDALALWKLGELALRTDPRAAAEYLTRSVAITPDLPQAVLAYGRALAGLGQTERATREYHRAILLDPEEDSVHYHLAQAYRLLGRKAEAAAEMARFEQLAKAKSERTRNEARQLIELTREEQPHGETAEPGFNSSAQPVHH
jgi:tetratricopeptide (TPR) repeat protein